jgi:hypothetical protein
MPTGMAWSKMLAALVAQPGEIVDRAALQAAIWGSATIVDFEFPALEPDLRRPPEGGHLRRCENRSCSGQD